MNILARSVLFSFVILLLASCGGGGSSSSAGGGSNLAKADAGLDPVSGPFCKGANTVTKSSSGMKCDWNCAEYEGKVGFVSLFFTKSGGVWSFEDAVVVNQCLDS